MDALLADLAADDWITAGNSTVGTQYMQISAIGTPAGNGTAGISIANVNLTTNYNLYSDVTANTTTRYWEC
jgi:hypothetical protein